MTAEERERRHKEAVQRVNARMKQWEALDSDDTEAAAQAAIEMGKEYLGQRDEPEEIEIPPEQWDEFFRELIGENSKAERKQGNNGSQRT